jgi:hypothetical protein
MLALTFDAILKCPHINGLVINTHSQDWVTISEPRARDKRSRASVPLLIEPDPTNRTIIGCPNINLGIWPCLHTIDVQQGYSHFVTIGGKRVCLKSVKGITDGSPGVQEYSVEFAGQNFVMCSE